MLKRLFIIILVTAFIGSNIYLINTIFSLFNILMFLLVCYILVYARRRYDQNFIVVMGLVGIFILIGFIYLLLYYRDIEQTKDFIYMTYVFNFFFIIYSAIKESRTDFFRSLFFTMIIIETFLLVFAIIEVKTGLHLKSSLYSGHRNLYIPTTVFSNPNDLSVITTMFFPLLFYLAGYFKKKFLKFYLVVVTSGLVIISMSRASLVMLLIFPLFNLIIGRKLIKFSIVAFSLIGLVLILNSITFKYLPNKNTLFVRNYNRLVSLIDIRNNISDRSSSFSKRIQIYEIVWENPEEFIFGKGFRAASIIIPEKRNIAIIDPHSFFIEVVFNFGFIGLIPIILLIFIPLYYSLKFFGRHSLFRLAIIQTLYFIILINIPSSIFRFPLVWVPFLTAYSMILTSNEDIFQKEYAC